jgi:hypothetical protein
MTPLRRRPRGHVTIRFSDAELALLRERAHAAGLTVSAYVRGATLGVPPSRLDPETSLATRYDRSLMTGLRLLGTAVAGQLAHQLAVRHRGRHPGDVGSCDGCSPFWRLVTAVASEGRLTPPPGTS